MRWPEQNATSSGHAAESYPRNPDEVDLSVTDADIEIRRLKSGGVAIRVKSAKISLLAKPRGPLSSSERM